VAHFQAGRLKEAEAELSEIQRRQPDIPEVLQGGALKRAGRLEEAVLAYDKAVSLGPELAEAHYNLGNAGNSFGVPFFMSPVSVIHPVHSS